MRRPRPTRHNSWSSTFMMTGPISQNPVKMPLERRDTGFPESLAKCTTTLPHPDADTSPNACISADDVPASKVFHRSRRSFLAKHKHTIGYGKLSKSELMYSDVTMHAGGSESSLGGHEDHHEDGGESLGRSSSSISEGQDKSPGQPEVHKRRSMLQRLGFSK